ncbi:hypothetical protein AQZ49_00210 [Novosphingobium sp. FSW06-99]|nr:hypothetical protein AQZ49_00210 [Novosphingobium sp. FSW06-99]
MIEWLKDPWSLFAGTFIVGVVMQVLLPRQRWFAAVLSTAAPIALLTFTIWWRIWDKDALWALGYVIAVIICFAASMPSIPAAQIARRLYRS